MFGMEIHTIWTYLEIKLMEIVIMDTYTCSKVGKNTGLSAGRGLT